jgi:thiamine biosynthesis lipoprotein
VNRLKRGETTVVTPEVFRCLELAESVHRYTEGSFDVAWQMPLRERTRSIRPFRLLPDGLKIRAIRSPLRLDLDGIGKGFALDRTAALLREWDLTDLLLAADRSTLLAPRGGETRWPIRFEDTKTNKLSLALQDGAVSASGTSVRGAHIADPRRRTTFPLAWKRLWVRLDRTKAEHAFGDREIAAWADALSTALLVGNRRTIATWLARRPAVEVWALASPPGATLEKIAPAT